jgi:hypothetical protein
VSGQIDPFHNFCTVESASELIFTLFSVVTFVTAIFCLIIERGWRDGVMGCGKEHSIGTVCVLQVSVCPCCKY